MAERSLFPLIRLLSGPITGILAKTPISANQVTALSLVFGLSSGWFIAGGDHQSALLGAVLLVVCYVLDNSDGEIARLKNQSSTFGMHFDTAVDWIVHSVFFVALGIGVSGLSGEEIWKWLGWTAAVGGTINYGLGLHLCRRDRNSGDVDWDDSEGQRPKGAIQWLIFMFRELARADFCFLVVGLATFDVLWVLLPAGAIGAQIYWLLLLVKSARNFHT